ncbi:Secreted RxLR effector protein [Sesamum angolense]|uniref:Secreted RxLR effector protein n=1 Tax=Sesamum angolense TaxID=2727404 RepID=A0AAE1WB05_9LAMI|nr:Secreted RxLR effector protein [Sesamum angolense]
MAKSIRIMLTIATWYDYEIWKIDVKTAFLNGFVEKEIYMDQPEGFTSVAEGLPSQKNDFDPCIYKKVNGSLAAFLVLYVDDILLIENDVKMLVVGSIQYVVQCTRSDVAFALSVTSRYQACASKAHWTTVKTILKYQRRTKDMFVYGGVELILEGYSDASFQSYKDNAKSQSGFVFKLNGGVVAWKSSK